MKTIGLIGGMSWQSSIEYYRIINEMIQNALGKNHSAKIIMESLDFQEIVDCQKAGNWDCSANILGDAAKNLQNSGADYVMICTNTMHKVADAVQSQISVPLIHICDAAAEKIVLRGIKKIALLGTKYTMEQDFYVNKLQNFGLDVIIPDLEDRDIVSNVIFEELCKGVILDKSRENYKRIIAELAKKGAEGVLLGCTEIALLINQDDVNIPVFDTTLLHAQKAVELMLEDHLVVMDK